MSVYAKVKSDLNKKPRKWLITGVAGFIGSNLLETLLKLDQAVIGLDNFATGYKKNLDQVRSLVSAAQWQRFDFIDEDIRDFHACQKACRNVDFVLHQAALGSVPRSIEDPLLTNECNIDGFLNMMVAARDAGVQRFVYAASSATYGDAAELPKIEKSIGRALSPYALTKRVNELYADVFALTYGFKCIGLRYFNIFGPRQDPMGAYAAVIPKWFDGLIRQEKVFINGDGETSRDFCYIDNCVQANILAACCENETALNQVYNIAFGERTTLNALFEMIRARVAKFFSEASDIQPTYRDFRPGDVRHSLADISKANELIGYVPEYSVKDGLDKSAQWYVENL